MNIEAISITVNVVAAKNIKYTKANTKVKFVEDILNLIEAEFGVNREQIQSQNRLRAIVEARHVLFYLMRNSRFDFGVTEIGLIFNRDHTTVIHGVKQINNLIQFNKEYRNTIEKLMFKMSIL
jgi:chromosomal replication initiator protein